MEKVWWCGIFSVLLWPKREDYGKRRKWKRLETQAVETARAERHTAQLQAEDAEGRAPVLARRCVHHTAPAAAAVRGGRVRELCGGGAADGADGHQDFRRLLAVPVGRRVEHGGLRRPARAEARGHRLAGVRADGHARRGLPHGLSGAHGG